jgi:predicted dehydrogenase
MGKKSPVTVGVLGLGRAGWNIHILGIRDRKDYRVVAAVDRLADRRKQAEDELGCETYKDFKSMLKGCGEVPELIIVANQTQDHCPSSITAMKAGAHVLVEKPCGVNAREVKRMIAASKKTRKKLFMHHNYRFKNSVQYLFQHMKKSPIGPVFEIHGNFTGYARRIDWQTQKRLGGGLLGNHGTHVLDIMLQMLGSPVKDVFCDMKHVSDAGNCEDHCKVVIRAKNGKVADLTLSTSIAIQLPHWILCGAYGTMTMTQQDAHLRYYDPKKVPKLNVDLGAPPERKYGTGEKLPWVDRNEKAEGRDIGNIYDNIVSVLRKGGKMYVTPESVLQTVTVLDMCRKQNPKFA